MLEQQLTEHASSAEQSRQSMEEANKGLVKQLVSLLSRSLAAVFHQHNSADLADSTPVKLTCRQSALPQNDIQRNGLLTICIWWICLSVCLRLSVWRCYLSVGRSVCLFVCLSSPVFITGSQWTHCLFAEPAIPTSTGDGKQQYHGRLTLHAQVC